MESPKLSHTIDIARAKRIAKALQYIIHQGVDDRFKLPTNPSFPGLIVQAMNQIQSLNGGVLSSERIVSYLVYQVYRYRDMIGHNFKTEWCFGATAVDKYQHQKSGMQYYIDRWCQEYDVDKRVIKRMVEPPRKNPMLQYINMPSEESVKRRWFNTEMGFVLCQQSTTGWAPKSESCKKCNYANRCEVETTHKYPELVRLRKQK